MRSRHNRVENVEGPALKISISNLSEGIHAFHFSTEPAHLGLGENFTKEVFVDVTIDKTSREVFLKADVRAFGTFTCDRCVDEFDRQVNATHHIVYIFDEKDKHQYPNEDVQVISTWTPFIDIADDIRQFLLLAIPLKLLCKENCSGLCPHCGTNHNYGTCSCDAEEIEPRWRALKKHFPN